MSAFEVDTAHINALVNAALVRTHGGETLRWYYRPDPDVTGTRPGEMMPSHEDYVAELNRSKREVTSANAGQWGATLLAENRRSVNHRYDEEEVEEVYEFAEYGGQISPVAILSAISCYEYQSCEHPEWKASEAQAFCDALQRKMIRMLPGYDSAPWEITDIAQAYVGEPTPVWRGGPFPPAPGMQVSLSSLAASRTTAVAEPAGRDLTLARIAGIARGTAPDGESRRVTDAMIDQVGRRNILAISGGRIMRRASGITLPAGNGYRVSVDLDPGSDTYTVRRLFVRGGTVYPKGERRGVHCEELGETAYQASCFRNVKFGEAA